MNNLTGYFEKQKLGSSCGFVHISARDIGFSLKLLKEVVLTAKKLLGTKAR
ncbi:MAG: hypothetical protein HWN79_10035 [Candidatus Lokiarchaeota archaeon]|nr:hypothetical protein [Candidatus Lokiarchaeota archaeon]